MVRLANILFRARMLYPRPIVTAPDILVLDIARPFTGPGLPLGRYYALIVETPEELREVESFLHRDRSTIVAPDLLDRRPSNRSAAHITLSQYDAPVAGWPHILLCHWPADYVATIGDQEEMFVRGAYTVELFASPQALVASTAKLIRALGATATVSVKMISGDRLTPAGNA